MYNWLPIIKKKIWYEIAKPRKKAISLRNETREEIVLYNVKQHSSIHNVVRKFKRTYEGQLNTVSNIIKQVYFWFQIIWPSSGTWVNLPWRIHWVLSMRLIWETQHTYINKLGRLFYRAETYLKRKQCKVTLMSTTTI